MVKKDHLFYLIKSLSKSEKRYFKRFAAMGNGGDKSYLRLFEFIDKQDQTSDQAIRDHFQGEKFLDQLHVIKNYLSALIMKSLRNYHQAKSKSTELRQLLCEAEILIEKELYDPSRVTIDKVIRQATKYEKFAILAEAHRLKRQLLQATKGFVAKESILDILKEEKVVFEKMLHLNGFQNLSYSMTDSGFGPVKENFQDHSLLANATETGSLQSQVLYYHTQYASHAVNGETDEAISTLDHVIKLMEANPHRIEDDPRSYITLLNNKIGTFLHAKRLDEIPAILEKVRDVPARYKMAPNRYKVKMFLSTYNVELELYRDTRQWQKGIELINVVNAFLEENKGHVSEEHQVIFHYQFAYIFFMSDQLSEALKFLNQITGSKSGEVRTDIMTYARFLSLIIHFELRNIIVLKYAVASCRRYLQKRRQPLPYEKSLLKFFGKATTSPEAHWPDLFVKLKEQMFLKISPEEKAEILDYLNYETWIDKNLEQTIKTVA